MATLDLDTALAIVAAARDRARATVDKPLAFAVVDAGGHVVVQARDDGAGFQRAKIALDKAWGCVAMGVTSRALGEQAAGWESWFVGVHGSAGARLVPVAGGVFIRDAGGAVLGAIGVSGAPHAVDEAVAVHAVEAVGLAADTG